MNASGQLFESLLVGWLLILVPVYIGETPEKRMVSEVLCHLQVLCAVFSLRRAVKFHHFLAGGLLIKSGDSVQFFGEGFLRGDFGHIRVRPGVVSDDMASAAMRLTRSGWSERKLPTTKNAAGA